VAGGTACGTDQICNAGTCVTCMQGSACTPASPCHTGTMDCTAGPSCTDTGGNQTNGSSCGVNEVCGDGMCVACVQAGPCTPTNPCHTGTTDCTSGAPVCNDTGVLLANGAACNGTETCCSGTCVDEQTNASNCGSCGHSCAACLNGQCEN
jgi:hypothetical protein